MVKVESILEPATLTQKDYREMEEWFYDFKVVVDEQEEEEKSVKGPKVRVVHEDMEKVEDTLGVMLVS